MITDTAPCVHTEVDNLMETLVEEQLAHLIAKPTGFRRLQLRPLWKGCFRANMYVKESTGSFRVAQSYFVRVGADGRIEETNPPLRTRVGA